MHFTSTIQLEPFSDLVDCEVDATFIPAEPEVGLDADWDIFVFVDGVDVTYDISKKDYQRLVEEAIECEKDLVADMMIDRYLDSLED